MKEKAGVYSFDKLVNTHDNGDHWFGNMAADASEIIASKACAEARKRYDAGMPAFEAAKDIPIGPYADYGDPERIVLNVNVLYKEFAGDPAPVNPVEQFAAMARWHA
jgi:glyoxylase-like metal-dependent hydrolase (beta-lactamase superfamily II)